MSRIYTLSCELLREPAIAKGDFSAMLEALRAAWPGLMLSQRDTVTIHGPNLADENDDDLSDEQREQLDQALAELDEDGRRG